MVAMPAPDGVTGSVHYRRYPLDEPFRESAMSREGGTLVGLAADPAPGRQARVLRHARARPGARCGCPRASPSSCASRATCRRCVLIPHVVAMFVVDDDRRSAPRSRRPSAAPEARRYAWVAVVRIAIGGLVLGPIVQKYAFGAFWTGWPFGADLTDNKTLAMWLAWAWRRRSAARRREPASAWPAGPSQAPRS